MSDKKAFTIFVGEEMQTITGIVRNFSVKFRGQMMPLQDLLYKYIRCSLAHEATLPKDVRFERTKELKVSVTHDCITFSDGLIDGLARAVHNARENQAEFY